MKLLSVIVPCYNSQDYMRYCLESLIIPGEECIEVIIVNDGSKDRTAEIAEYYSRKYPDTIRVIHQTNAGHGGAVNTGLKHASGFYFKVVDSDDWLDRRAYMKVLETLKDLYKNGRNMDLILSNYVYEKEGARFKKVIRYDNILPVETPFGWDDIEPFRKGQYLMMHSVIYRTGLLRECGLELPKHTFYVDNLYVFLPLFNVESFYYIDVDLYRYYIGRNDQSVNEKVMISRIDQQLLVNRIMVDKLVSYNPDNTRRYEYLIHHLEIITVVSSILLIISGVKSNYIKKRELWSYIKSCDVKIYRKLRRGFMGRSVNIHSAFGRFISRLFYMISKKIFGFN